MTVGLIGATVSSTPRNVANRGMIPLGFSVAISTTVCLEARMRHTLAASTPWIQFVDTGVYIDTSNVEQPCGNDQGIERWLEIPSVQSSPVRALYGGLNSGTITNGVAEYASDKIFASSFGLSVFPANTIFWTRARKTVSVGQSMTYGQGGAVAGYSGESEFYSDGASNQMGNSGVLTLPSGGSSATNQSLLPAAILGQPNRVVSVIGFGDSLIYGGNDTWSDGTSGMGWFPRALHSIRGNQIANANFGRGGSCAYQYVLSNAVRSAYYKYHTHAVIHYGTNDMVSFGANKSATTTYNNVLAMAQAMKTAGLYRVAASGVFIRTNTSNVPESGFENGGTRRDAYNSLISGAAGSTAIDEYFNISSAIQDATVTDTWNLTYNSDFVHANSSGHIALAALFANVAANWRLY